MRRVMLPYGHCAGTGKKEAPKLTETLAFLERGLWFSTQWLAAALHSGETNMANRLAELEELGLVEHRGSRPKEWRRTCPGGCLDDEDSGCRGGEGGRG